MKKIKYAIFTTLLFIVTIAICSCTKEHEHNFKLVEVKSTCETKGYTLYECACGHSYKANFTDESDHVYGKVTYTWNSDCTECEAVRVCVNNSTHKEIEKATITSETVAAKCEENGKTIYTARFTNPGFTTQTKEVEIVATDHKYGEVTYTWNSDCTECEAVRICANDSAHKEIEKAIITSETVAAKCEEAGKTTYTAVFTNSAFTTQTKEVAIEELGHSNKEWEVVYAAKCYELGKEQSLCSNCSTYIYRDIPYINHSYEFVEKILPTYETRGYSIYKCINEGCNHTKNDDYVSKLNDLTFTLNDDKTGYIVNGNNNTKYSRSIEIPSTYNNLPVVKIGETGFINCINLIEIVIPNSIIQIKEGAFAGCYSIEKMTIPFAGCVGNEFWGGSLTYGSSSVSFAFGSLFGRNVFENSYKATQNIDGEGFVVSFYIPESLKEVTVYDDIRMCSFNNIYSLEKVTIKNAEFIADSSFLNCSSLKEIEIPSTLKNIYNTAFTNCNNLESVYYNGTIDNWFNISFSSTVSNPMWFAEKFYCINSLGDYYYPTEIVTPASITEIGNYQLASFEQLEKIEISEKVTKVGYAALSGCVFLEYLKIPFAGLYYYDGDSSSNLFGSIFGNYEHDLTTIVYQTYDFYNSLSMAYYIPNSLNTVEITKYIGNYSLSNLDIIENIVIGDNVLEIGDYAFYSCDGITSINIPKNVEIINFFAFRNCKNLESVYIDNSSIEIDYNVFAGCEKITDVYYCSSSTNWNNLTIQSGNDYLLNAEIHYYS